MANETAATSEEFVPRWEVVKNIDSIDIPPFAAVEVGAFQANNVFGVKRPTGDSLPYVMIVNEGGIPVGKEGLATFQRPTPVLYRTADGDPVAGDLWGTVVNTFTLGKTKAGFFAITKLASGIGVFGHSSANPVSSQAQMTRHNNPASTDAEGLLQAWIQVWLDPAHVTVNSDGEEILLQLLG
jgi:hypothetical protein